MHEGRKRWRETLPLFVQSSVKPALLCVVSDMHFMFSFLHSVSFTFCSSVSCDLLFLAYVFLFSHPLISSLSLSVRITSKETYIDRQHASLELSYTLCVLF